VDHLYPDAQGKSLSVMLVVWKTEHVLPQNRHWAIAWQVGAASNKDPVHRMLAIVRERGPTGPLGYLTNWGPKTRIAGVRTKEDAVFYSLAMLTYAQRQALEKISAEEVVHEPDGQWSCQTWVVSVLHQGAKAGLFQWNVVKAAIEEAMK
jgi:hypothetical protein